MAIFHSSLVHFFGLFMLLNTNVIAKNACDFNVKVKQVLLNEGFHRYVTLGSKHVLYLSLYKLHIIFYQFIDIL